MFDYLGRAVAALHERFPLDHAAGKDETRPTVAELESRRDELAGGYWAEMMSGDTQKVDPAEAVRRAVCARGRADAKVLDEYVHAVLTPRAAHDAEHRDLYAVASAQAVLPDHIDDPGPDREWMARARAAGFSTETLENPEDYVGPLIEDVAIPPDVSWNAADLVTALESVIATYGIEAGQWYEVDWPPEVYLSNAGHVYQTEWEPCAAHFEDDDSAEAEQCLDCEASVRTVVEQPAEWSFTTKIRTLALAFDDDGRLTEAEVWTESGIEIRSLTQDPRCIEVGPPGQGIHW